MLELFLQGGWVMLPILICSVIGLTIVFEKLWSLKLEKIAPVSLIEKVESNLVSHTNTNIQKTIEDINDKALGRLVAIILNNMNSPKDSIEKILNSEAQIIQHHLAGGITLLTTIGVITPLLGLLGTILGMIDVFFIVVEKGVGDPKILAGGISKSLITTAFGISVAVPSVLFARYLKRKLDSIMLQMQNHCQYFIEKYCQ